MRSIAELLHEFFARREARRVRRLARAYGCEG